MKSLLKNPYPAVSPLGLGRKPSSLLALSFALFGMLAASPQTHAMYVDLNTSALNGTSALLDFSLLDGDNTQDNQATISGLATDVTGSLLSNNCLALVSCVATAGSFTISDANSFGEFQQFLILGNDVNFNLDVSNVFAGGAPDRLVVSLLDPGTSFTLITTNLNLTDATSVQDALLTVDFTGGAGNLIRQATVSDPFVGVTVVPSPAPWVLILPWGFWWVRRGRLSRSLGSTCLTSNQPLSNITNY